MKLVAGKCPNCGSNIKVDRSLKYTKCEYCNSQIEAEEAVENLIKVEFKDTPTLDNYLKLGDRYFKSKQYEESYEQYSKALEISPDNPIAILRKGLSKTMNSTYNRLDIASSIESLKTSLDLMNKMSFDKKDIDDSIKETLFVLVTAKDFLKDTYSAHKLNKAQTEGYIERLEILMDGFSYLEKISVYKSTTDSIQKEIVDNIDLILGNVNNANYSLSTKYVNELKNKRNKYTSVNDNKPKKREELERVVEVKTKASIIKDILSYLTIVFLLLLFIAAENILEKVLWLLSAISFIPKIKTISVKKYGSLAGTIIIYLRVILVVVAIIVLGNQPIEFEKVYSSDTTQITLEKGKYKYQTKEEIIEGTYHWETKDDDYYIYVETTDNKKYTYRYKPNGGDKTLCLMEEKKCLKSYIPIDYLQ